MTNPLKGEQLRELKQKDADTPSKGKQAQNSLSKSSTQNSSCKSSTQDSPSKSSAEASDGAKDQTTDEGAQKYTIVLRGHQDFDIQASPNTTLSEVRKYHKIDAKWIFILPGIKVTTKIEDMLSLEDIEGDEIILEAPS